MNNIPYLGTELVALVLIFFANKVAV